MWDIAVGHTREKGGVADSGFSFGFNNPLLPAAPFFIVT
jgi:hypothetical protein